MRTRRARLLLVFAVAGFGIGSLTFASSESAAPKVAGPRQVSPLPARAPSSQAGEAQSHGVARPHRSPPLRTIPPGAPRWYGNKTIDQLRGGKEAEQTPGDLPAPSKDGALQKVFGGHSMPAPIVSFDGVTNRNGLLPPDTNGDIGPNHYMQIVNVSFGVYNRDGTVAYGPANNNLLFGGTPICGTAQPGRPCRPLRPVLRPVARLAVRNRPARQLRVRLGLGDERPDRLLVRLRVSDPPDEVRRLPEVRRLARSERVLHDGQPVRRRGVGRGGRLRLRARPDAGLPARALRLRGHVRRRHEPRLAATRRRGRLDRSAHRRGDPARLHEGRGSGPPQRVERDDRLERALPERHARHRALDDALQLESLRRLVELHPAARHERRPRAALRPADAPARVPKLRRLANDGRRPHGHSGIEPCGHPVVRADRHRRRLGNQPAGDVRPDRRAPSLDGQHRAGLEREHGARLLRLELDDLSEHPLHGQARRRPAGDASAGRGVDHGRRRLAAERVEPLGRLLRDGDRPERRLHVLVHDRSTTRRPAGQTGARGSGPSGSRNAARLRLHLRRRHRLRRHLRRPSTTSTTTRPAGPSPPRTSSRVSTRTTASSPTTSSFRPARPGRSKASMLRVCTSTASGRRPR